MSVRSETYIIYGAKLDLKKTSKILDKRDNSNLDDIQFPWCGKGAKGQIGVLYDGMSGKYALAGYCIECGQEDSGVPLINLTKLFESHGFDVIDAKIHKFIDSNNLPKIEYEPSYDFLFDVFVVTHYH